MLKKQITHSQYFALVTWIKENKETILKERPTIAVLTDYASKALGFRVGTRNVSQARVDAGVIVVSAGAEKFSSVGVLQTKFLALELEVQELRRLVEGKLCPPTE